MDLSFINVKLGSKNMESPGLNGRVFVFLGGVVMKIIGTVDFIFYIN